MVQAEVGIFSNRDFRLVFPFTWIGFSFYDATHS